MGHLRTHAVQKCSRRFKLLDDAVGDGLIRPADQRPEYRGHSSPNIRKHRFIFVMEEIRQGADLFREAILAVAAERPAPLLGVLQRNSSRPRIAGSPSRESRPSSSDTLQSAPLLPC
jgi:hypothetical protein